MYSLFLLPLRKPTTELKPQEISLTRGRFFFNISLSYHEVTGVGPVRGGQLCG